jgi:hypothetical protein
MTNEKKQLSDAELVTRALVLTSRLSDPERAAEFGVTHTTIARWKAGHGGEDGWKQLQAGTRRKLEDYIDAAANTNGSERMPSQPGEPHRDGSAELWRRIDQVNALTVSETVKIVKIEALSAALRAEAASAEARAAEARGRALERDGAAAEGRARAVEEEAKGAAERTRALREDRADVASVGATLEAGELAKEVGGEGDRKSAAGGGG